MTFAALRLPAGKFKPIFSSLSLKDLPIFRFGSSEDAAEERRIEAFGGDSRL